MAARLHAAPPTSGALQAGRLPVPAADKDPGRGFRLVQFTGPTRAHWLQQLASDGLEPLRYCPHNACPVRSEPGPHTRLARDGFARWHGASESGFRLAAELQGRRGRIAGLAYTPAPVRPRPRACD